MIVQTRLGDVSYTREDVYTFSPGLCGFENLNQYVLCKMPQLPEEKRFYILQSLEVPHVCFILKEAYLEKKYPPSLESFLKKLSSSSVRVFETLVVHDKEDIISNKSSPLIFQTDIKCGWQKSLHEVSATHKIEKSSLK